MLPIGDQTPEGFREWLPIILTLLIVLICIGSAVWWVIEKFVVS